MNSMEKNSYHLYVHLDGTEENAQSAVAGSTAKDSKQPLSYGEKSARSLQKGMTNLVSFASVAATADKLIGYEINSVELRTGAREYEQRLQFGYSVAQRGVTALAAVGIGAATGNLPAVVIGLVAAGVNTAISLSQRKNTLQMQENLENVSIGMANVRAGTAGRRGANR